jgi:hypothetical protein
VKAVVAAAVAVAAAAVILVAVITAVTTMASLRHHPPVAAVLVQAVALPRAAVPAATSRATWTTISRFDRAALICRLYRLELNSPPFPAGFFVGCLFSGRCARLALSE